MTLGLILLTLAAGLASGLLLVVGLVTTGFAFGSDEPRPERGLAIGAVELLASLALAGLTCIGLGALG